MTLKDFKSITVSDLLNQYIVINGMDGSSADVYNSISNQVVLFNENTALESAESSKGVTKVYDAYAIDFPDVDGKPADDMKKGTLIVRLYQNSDASKSKVQIAVRTDIDNTYNIPVNPSSAYHAVNEYHYTGNEGQNLIMAVSVYAKAEHEIVNYSPTLELFDGVALYKTLNNESNLSAKATAEAHQNTVSTGSSSASSVSSQVQSQSSSKGTSGSATTQSQPQGKK